MSNSFADLGVPTSLVRVLAQQGITEPFPIQRATLPDALAGRDVLGRGRTGSGKTIAFALPTVVALSDPDRGRGKGRRVPGKPRALVLVPTRELATQVAATFAPLAAAAGLKTLTIFGGVGQNPQVSALRAGVDVVIACPGRLEDLIGQGHCRLDAVEVTVLDEADHMADLGFLPAVKRLLDATGKGGQRLLFSATLDNAIDQLVRRYLHNPVTHSVDSSATAPPAMAHHLFQVAADTKPAVVRRLLAGQGRTLAFTRTKHRAKRLARDLTAAGIPAVDLHGNLSQAARERNLAAFGDGRTRVLVATDIAARGIHVDDVTLVVHVDPPAEHKAYLHRSGRTARAGAAGVVVTVSTPDERADVRSMMRKAGIQPTTVVGPDTAVIEQLTGPAADLVTPAPVDSTRSASSGRSGGRGSRGGSGRGAGRTSASASGEQASGTSRRGGGSTRAYRTRSDGTRSDRTRADRGAGGGRASDGRTSGATGRTSGAGGRTAGGRSAAAPAGSTGGAAGFSAGRRRGR